MEREPEDGDAGVNVQDREGARAVRADSSTEHLVPPNTGSLRELPEIITDIQSNARKIQDAIQKFEEGLSRRHRFCAKKQIKDCGGDSISGEEQDPKLEEIDQGKEQLRNQFELLHQKTPTRLDTCPSSEASTKAIDRDKIDTKQDVCSDLFRSTCVHTGDLDNTIPNTTNGHGKHTDDDISPEKVDQVVQSSRGASNVCAQISPAMETDRCQVQSDNELSASQKEMALCLRRFKTKPKEDNRLVYSRNQLVDRKDEQTRTGTPFHPFGNVKDREQGTNTKHMTQASGKAHEQTFSKVERVDAKHESSVLSGEFKIGVDDAHGSKKVKRSHVDVEELLRTTSDGLHGILTRLHEMKEGLMSGLPLEAIHSASLSDLNKLGGSYISDSDEAVIPTSPRSPKLSDVFQLKPTTPKVTLPSRTFSSLSSDTSSSSHTGISVPSTAVESTEPCTTHIHATRSAHAQSSATAMYPTKAQTKRVSPDTQVAGATAREEETNVTLDDSGDDEHLTIDEDAWSERVNLEIVQGRENRPRRKEGPKTIICLDISDSMKGQAWEQALNFVRGFLDEIEKNAQTTKSSENLSLVTFGHETKVQQHVTSDYQTIRRKLESLRPGGSSPMYAGLRMCSAAVDADEVIFRFENCKFEPRVLLLTDGKVTPSLRITGPDLSDDHVKTMEQKNIVALISSLYKKQDITVHSVPVGQFDKKFLQQLADGPKGMQSSAEEWSRAARHIPNCLKAIRVINCERSAIAAALCSPTDLYEVLLQGEDKEDKEDILKVLKDCTTSTNAKDTEEENSSLPLIGTRVRRGPDWMWGNQDSHGVGTVTSYLQFDKGSVDAAGQTWVNVWWDRKDTKGSNKYRYRMGIGNCYDLVVVDEPRVLGSDDLIAPGCVVRRGQDWSYGDRDGGLGNEGVVYGVDDNALIKVRWSNGQKEVYRYGFEGFFDVKIVDQTCVHRGKPNESYIEKMNRINKEMTMKCIADHPEGASSPTAGRVVDKNSKQLNHLGERHHGCTAAKEPEGACIEYKRGGSGTSSDVVSDSTQSMVSNQDDEKSPSPERGAVPKKRKHVDSSGSVMTSRSIVWQWKRGDGEWIVYSPVAMAKIEKSFKRGSRSALVINDDQQYRLLFNQMEQINSTTNETSAIRRLETV